MGLGVGGWDLGLNFWDDGIGVSRQVLLRKNYHLLLRCSGI